MKGKGQMKKFLAMALSSAMAFTALPGQLPAVTAEGTGAKALEIWFDEPVSQGKTIGSAGGFNTTEADNIWQQLTLPIGNGSIGANVYGEVSREHLTFNEKTLWNGGPGESRPDYNGGNLAVSDDGTQMSEVFRQVQELYKQGKDSEAKELAKKLKGSTDGYGAYQSWGDIYLDYGFHNEECTDYRRNLDLESSISNVDFVKDGTKYHREYFISYPDQVLAVKLTAEGQDKMDLKITFPIDNQDDYKNPDNSNAPTLVERKLGKETATTVEGSRLMVSGQMQDNQLMLNGQILVKNTDGQVKEGADGESLQVVGASEIVLYVSADTNYADVYPNYRTEDTKDTLRARVGKWADDAAAKGYDGVKAAHESDYKKIFDRVSLDLGQGAAVSSRTTDALLAAYKDGTASDAEKRALETLLFQYGRYLTIASSRDGDLPSNLQGLWQNRVGDANRVPWGSDYHMNVNLQMNYWPTYSTNMLECATPLIDYINGLQKPGEVTAQTYFGVEAGQGFTAHTQNTPFGWTCPGWDFSWGWSPAALPWILQNCYEYYEYSGNTEYLKNNIYPLLKESALLYDNILMEKDGRMVSAPAYSPEHGPVSAGNTYEQSLIWQLYEDAIHSAEILGVDSDKVAEWKETQSKLNPIEIGDSGQIKEWYNETTFGSVEGWQANHRHMSHLLGLFPGDLINVDNAEYMDAAIVSLAERGTQSTGWGIGQRINAWARTGEGDSAYACVQSLFQGGMYPNLWDSHAPFQIDGNFGYTSGVAEMLMQSNAGYINVLPALPSVWSEGQVSGLVARGNFEISMEWSQSSPNRVEITSKNGGKAQVQSENIAMATVTDSEGNPVQFEVVNGDRISFDTAKDGAYIITNIPQRGVKLEAPEKVAADRIDDDTVSLEWSAVEGIAESGNVTYTVYRQIDNGEVLAIAKDIADCTYLDEEAPEIMGNAKYQVQAVEKSGIEVNPGERSAMTAAARPATGMVDDRDTAITYSAGWSTYGEEGLYNKTSHFVESPTGAETAELRFSGTGIKIYATVNSDRGMADVYIDGKKAGVADSYAATKKNFTEVYAKTDLKAGVHTVKMVLTNEKNQASTKGKFEFDAFEAVGGKEAVSGVSVTSESGISTLAKANSTLQMQAQVETDRRNKNVAWSVDDESLAAIDENGLLTIKDKNGTVTVTAASAIDEEVTGSMEINIRLVKLVEKTKEVEDTDNSGNLNTELTYTGSWEPWNGNEGHHGGWKTESSTAGDSIAYTFTGTGIDVYAPTNTGTTGARVTLDGVAQDTIKTYGEDVKGKLVASFSNLENKEHTIVLTVATKEEAGITEPVARSNFGLDYFVVHYQETQQEMLEKTKEVEDADSSGNLNTDIAYAGSWEPWNGNEGHHGGYKTESSTAGDSITYTFTGTGIDVYAPTNTGTTGALVTLDGVIQEPIKTYGEDIKGKLVASYLNLENKEHTIVLTVATKEEAGITQTVNRSNFGLDYFVVHYLEEVQGGAADKATLQNSIEANAKKYAESYTAASYAGFKTAYNAAVAAMNDPNADQAAVNTAMAELDAAAAALLPAADSDIPAPDTSASAVKASGVESKTLMLIWKEVPDAVSYTVYQNNTKMQETKDTYLRVSGLTPDTQYTFRVEAVNRVGKSADIGTGVAVTTAKEAAAQEAPPTPVQELKQAEADSRMFTWTKSASDDVLYYEVFVNGVKQKAIEGNGTLAFDLDTVINGRQARTLVSRIYTVSVVAVNTLGLRSNPVSVSVSLQVDVPDTDKTVKSIQGKPTAADVISAEKGTKAEDLKLPKEVTLTVAAAGGQEESMKASIQWSTGSYDAASLNAQVLDGQIVLPAGVKIANAEELKVQITVKLTENSAAKPDISKVETTSVTVSYGAAIEKVLELLPTQVKVELTGEDGSISAGYANVTWDALKSYDGTKAGVYKFSGVLAAGDAYTNTQELKAVAEVKVNAQASAQVVEIQGKPTAEDVISAVEGTKAENLGLPQEVSLLVTRTAKLSETIKASIQWNTDNYDAASLKAQILEGVIVLPEGVEIANAEDLKVQITVQLKAKGQMEKPDIVKVEESAITVSHGTGIDRVIELLPSQVKVELKESNGSTTVKYVNVSWNAMKSYDGTKPGIYEFSGMIAVGDSYTNTQGLKAVAKVTVNEKAATVPGNNGTGGNSAGSTESKDPAKSVKTGDNAPIGVWMSFLLGAAAVLVYSRKKKRFE